MSPMDATVPVVYGHLYHYMHVAERASIMRHIVALKECTAAMPKSFYEQGVLYVE